MHSENIEADAEAWVAISVAPAYEVSSLGRVRRALPSKTSGKVGAIIRSNINGRGYYHVTLWGLNKLKKTHAVHILVCTAFHGDRPSRNHQAAHLDGNPFNNRQDNLAWATVKENVAHKYIHGTVAYGEATRVNKLTTAQVLDIRSRGIRSEKDCAAVAAELGVGTSTVYKAAHGYTWTHLPFPARAALSGDAQ